jgi:thymidylate synthase
VKYTPYSKRKPNTDYKDLLREIRDNGVLLPSTQDVDAKMIFGAKPMRFKLSNGFPILTERDLSKFWRAPIGEMIGFINGARTQEELEKYGCKWWKYWVTKEKCAKRGLEEGDLGPGSYGAAFHDFPTSEGEPFNQIEHLIKQIKEKPGLRTHFVTPWIPQYIYRVKGKTQKVVVCPCHGWMHWRVINDKLSLHMFQRSGDVPIGVPSNMIQYSALLLMVAQTVGLEPDEYIHTISDAHIFVDQMDAVDEVISRETRPFPTVKLTKKRDNIFDYRIEDFELSDYHPLPAITKIPAAI